MTSVSCPVECMCELCFLQFDKVKKARNVLRYFNGPHSIHFIDLLKHKEICISDVLFLEVFDASLTLLYCVHNHVEPCKWS